MWLLFKHIICDAEENEVAFPKIVLLNQTQEWPESYAWGWNIILKTQDYEKKKIHLNSGLKNTVYEGKPNKPTTTTNTKQHKQWQKRQNNSHKQNTNN